MKILHLLSQTELTGAEVYAKALIEKQFQDGHEIFVISDSIHVSLPVPWISEKLSINTWSQRRKNIQTVRSLILESKIDVLHAHSRAAVRVAHGARKNLPVGMVSTIHGRQHSSFGKRFQDSYGDYKLLICENLRQQFEQDLKSSPGTLRIVRNPFPEIHPTEHSKLERKNKIVFMGRSSGPKGRRLTELFDRGLFDFLDRHPEITFDIVSHKPEHFGQSFLHQIQSWKNSQQIRILSSETHPSQVLATADLVLGAGRVAIEGLLQGVSVLAFGEYTAHGLVRKENWSECLASNFGDIGPQHEGALNSELILQDLESFYSASREDGTPELQKMAAREFSLEKIHQETLDSYKAALFRRNVPHGIPVLMYHRVPDQNEPGKHRIFVEKNRFARHLKFFSEHFETLQFQTLAEFWHLRRPYSEFPKKPLVLTFDDGYEDNLRNAHPLLKNFGLTANLFLLSDTRIQKNTWDPEEVGVSNRLMSPNERAQISTESIFEIGSHGLTHRDFTNLSDSEIFHELCESKTQLQNEFKKSIHAFAAPFGKTDSRLPGLCAKAGYDFAVNTDSGGLHWADDRFSIFRVNIFPEDGVFSIWKKTSSWYRKYYFRKRGR